MKITVTLLIGLLILMGIVAAMPAIQRQTDAYLAEHFDRRSGELVAQIGEANAEIEALRAVADADALAQDWYAQQQQDLQHTRTSAAARVILVLLVLVTPFLVFGIGVAYWFDRRLRRERQALYRQIRTLKMTNAAPHTPRSTPLSQRQRIVGSSQNLPPPSPLARRRYIEQQRRRGP